MTSNAVNMLQTHLNRLVDFVFKDGQCPAWSRVLIVEDSDITRREIAGKYTSCVPRHTLMTPEQYSSRFEAHMKAGYHWINMNAAGVLDDTLLVIIELPNYVSVAIGTETSINLSGAHIIGGMSKRETDDWLRVVD